MRALSSVPDRRETPVNAVVTARKEKDLSSLGQACGQVARLIKKRL